MIKKMNNFVWKPILKDNAQYKNVVNKIEDIARVLYEVQYDSSSIGALTGSPGIALFMYYYWLWSKRDNFYTKALEILSACVDYSTHNHNKVVYSFCSGISGLGWCLNLFSTQGCIEGNVDEKIAEIYPGLYQKMIHLINERQYDFLHGALGIGLFYKNNASNKYIENLLTGLNECAIKSEKGMFWHSLYEENNISNQVINLSMSHGLASIITFLCKISNRYPKAKSILKEATRFVIEQQQDNKIYSSCFPSIISETINHKNSRLAWCYGDLGIAIALWHASWILDIEKYRNIALDVFTICCNRRDIKKEFVIDAGICHGAAGIAHIFNRIYQSTGNPFFRETAIFWINICLKKALFEDGLAGYKIWRTKSMGGWINQEGLLEGVSGIGLVLLAAISDIEPKWDECLLLS